MSGDVQPRKRKDKKKKREDEASHGVHITKMGSDDVHLHIHEEHGTGGHWCAKIIFFSLMAVLMGLVLLIILENRGISDVDTPLSESRFSNYFDGWVDEHRGDHDDHHDSHGSVEHDDDHDEDDEHDGEDDHDEPFEEEADHSEGDEEEEVAEDEDDNVTPEEEDEEDDNATVENLTVEEEDEDEDEDVTAEVDDNVTAEDGEDENVTAEDENVTEEATAEQNDDEDNEDEDDDNKTNEYEDNATKETLNPTSQLAPEDDDDAFDEEDDGDSLEKIVDNDAAELELLKEKARQQAAAESKQNLVSDENQEAEADNVPSWGSSHKKPKSGGGPESLEDDDLDLFEQELRKANEEMMREQYKDALNSYDQLIKKYPRQPQGYLGKAQTMDQYAEQIKSNDLLMEALQVYNTYLKFDVEEDQLFEYLSAGERCLNRLKFLGKYYASLPIHHLLIKKFPHIPHLRNQLAITYLMIHRLLEAKQVLQETVRLWPEDGLALVHYGFILKQLDQDYYNASFYLRKGIETKADGTRDGRFYLQLGESYQRLGKQDEAVKVFRRGAALKLFPSVHQRSLYNEPNLKAQPFWSIEETTYEKFFRKLQDNWLAIKAEGLNVLSKQGFFLDESEHLKDSGDWKQFELYAIGRKNQENCLKTPITCSLLAEFSAAIECRPGQVKFSVIHPGTHVWPHCGPTNCRIRAHLGLVCPPGTRIRVDEEERTWQEGKFLIFDDSFEHEIWHEGHSLRLVLIVDVWHPELAENRRRALFPF